MISKFSVKKPYTVLVGVILVIVLGVVSFTRMTADLLPNISLPYVLVMTTYPGASPETVETVVTQPVEASMATVSNIESISSVSNENYSMVILEFAQSADMNAVSLEIRENLDQIKSFWDDSVGNPIIMKLNPDMMPVMIAAVGVDGMDQGAISTYVSEEIMPSLESLEGVASVSATGLLEKSVNVIIRQDKVDALNEKVRAAIDDKMKEAEDELNDGRQTIADSKKELADGKKELADGKQELADGEKELADGKQELTDKKNETTETLANTKKDLLTAKADLEATKMNMSTNLTTAKQLSKSIGEIDLLTTAPTTYQTALTALNTSVSDGDAAGAATAKKQIEDLKKSYLESTIYKEISKQMAVDPTMSAMLTALSAADWTDPMAGATVVAPALYAIQTAAANPPMSTTLNEQKSNLSGALNAITNGMGLTAYEKLVNSTIAALDEKLAAVNSGLVEVEKGQLTAAIEFANANAEISLGA